MQALLLLLRLVLLLLSYIFCLEFRIIEPLLEPFSYEQRINFETCLALLASLLRHGHCMIWTLAFPLVIYPGASTETLL